MYKIAVCDDDRSVRVGIAEMLREHERSYEFSVTPVEGGEELRDMIMDGRSFDLIILDSRLKGCDGIRLGHLLRKRLRNSATQLLFIAYESSCALRLFDLRPLNFIPKPVSRAKLYECIDCALSIMHGSGGNLDFTVNRTEYMIPFREIRYIESNNKQLTVHCLGGDYDYYGKLDEVAVPQDFIRIHQSYLVNSSFVRRLRSISLALDCGTELSISRFYRRQVREYFVGNLSHNCW